MWRRLTNQKSSQQQWIKANPGYWKQYRKDNPEKAGRNRICQAIRNRRARSSPGAASIDPALIAKMDASNSDNFQILGQFWLLPVIAKMDALYSGQSGVVSRRSGLSKNRISRSNRRANLFQIFDFNRKSEILVKNLQQTAYF